MQGCWWLPVGMLYCCLEVREVSSWAVGVMCRLGGSPFLAGEPDPPVQAGAASVARVTLAVVAAVAGQRAAGPKAIYSAVDVTLGSCFPRGTAALSAERVT